jgi:hypothetical protein
MKRVFKWIGIVLGGLVGFLLLTAVVLHFVGLSRLNNAPEVATKPVSVPTDAAARGAGRASGERGQLVRPVSWRKSGWAGLL